MRVAIFRPQTLPPATGALAPRSTRPAPPPAARPPPRRSLSNYNQELVSCIEDLREKREELNRSLLRDEEEKAKIQKELSTLTERLSRLNEDLARKMQARVEFDQTIQETECVAGRRAPPRRAARRAGAGRAQLPERALLSPPPVSAPLPPRAPSGRRT